MLKSTLNSPERSNSKRPTLPHLFKDNSSSMVALFISEQEAVVVVSGLWEVGDIKRAVVPCWDTREWTPLLPGESVTITVESED